jgi:hypothetical protein
MPFSEHAQTHVTIDKTRLLLKREWLYGLLSWAVYREGKKVGWVLQESEGPRWAYVTLEDDIYDDILYDFNTRESALRSLIAP